LQALEDLRQISTNGQTRNGGKLMHVLHRKATYIFIFGRQGGHGDDCNGPRLSAISGDPLVA
jgi:hypothetical protein